MMEIDCCDSCGYGPVAGDYYPDGGLHDPKTGKGEGAHLCALCAATPAGTALHYPAYPPTNDDIIETLCYVGNAILARLSSNNRSFLP